MHSSNFKRTAQGTIEYLVVLAVIIVISLVIVGIVGSNTNAQNIAATSGKIGNLTQGGFSIADALVGTDGSGLIALQNNSGEMLTVTGITLDGIDNNYSQQLAFGSKLLFSLEDLENACSCTGNAGTARTCHTIIYYTTQDGLQKNANYSVTVNCAISATPTDSNKIILALDQSAPTITLSSPADNYFSVSRVSFKFFASDNRTISQCVLKIDGVDKNTITSVANGEINIIDYNTGTLAEDTHTWDINCIDSSQNTSTSSSSRTLKQICDSRTAGGYFLNGSGSTADPYGLCDCNMLQDVNKATDANYILLSNIDCSQTTTWNNGSGFYPIGTFRGKLDGNGKIISGLFINASVQDSNISGEAAVVTGLFADIATNGIITKLGLADVNIRNGARYVGGITGVNQGAISNSYLSGIVHSSNGNANASNGGIAGENRGGTITNFYTTGTVSSDYYTLHTGGIIGGYSSSGTALNTYTTSSVSGYSCVGGYLGKSGMTVLNSFSAGTVTGDPVAVNFTGGFVGCPSGSNTGPTGSNSFWDNSSNMYYYTNAPMSSWGTWEQISGNEWATTNGNWSICNGAGYPWLTWENRSC